MFFHIYILFSLAYLTTYASDEIPRPRGVSLSRAPLYKPQASDKFTCLDGSLTIPIDQVNDDYCDCPDASDEPGTSACPHGQFHCTNAGHKPLNIPSSRVNDGICDCCDGSDEYHKTHCENTCGELGKTAREEARRQAELLRAGRELRAELAEKGAQLKKAKREELNELNSHKAEAEKVVLEKERLKKEIESQEAAALEVYKTIEDEQKRKADELNAIQERKNAIEAFHKLDSNQDGLLEINELQTRASFDTDRNGQISNEEARSYLNLMDENYDSVDLETFISNSWGTVKPIMLIEGGLFKGRGSVEEVPLGGGEYPDDNNQQGDDEHNLENEDEEDIEQEEADADEDLGGEYEDEGHAENSEGHDHGRGRYYDEATQRLVDLAEEARRGFSEADRDYKNIQSEISKLEEYLQKDFGSEDEFATLEGQCFDFQDYEYIYRICPFDKATQQQKSSSSETRLGTFAHWVPSDEAGSAGAYTTMLYDHGQSCWNGPSRSVRVVVRCGGSESRLVAVSEPNRCEYRFEFETPAACRDSTSASATEGNSKPGEHRHVRTDDNGDDDDDAAAEEYGHDEL